MFDKNEAVYEEPAIKAWCLENIGIELPVTCSKDKDMLELWDDRAVTVEHNTGRCLSFRTGTGHTDEVLQAIAAEVDRNGGLKNYIKDHPVTEGIFEEN
jgi:hypothetical protein